MDTKQYIIEQAAETRYTSEIVLNESCCYYKELSKRVVKGMVNKLLVDYEGGIQEDCFYLLNLKKEKYSEDAFDINGFKYTLRLTPVKKVK